MIKGRPIYFMQTCLRKLSNSYPIERVVANGVFDEVTEKAVKDFQRHFGYKQTGVIDDELYQKIVGEYKVLLNKEEDLPCFWENVKVFTKGDKSPYIALFQSTYNIFCEKFLGHNSVAVTSVMDDETTRAVGEIEKILSLKEDKILDKKVMEGLFSVLKVEF